MKTIFEITDKNTINEILDKTKFGTLSICYDNKPYSLPINFVRIDNALYFHGKNRGKKIDILKSNPIASFSVVQAFSVIQSYFSSKENLACPATQFFQSVIIDGKIKFIEDYDKKTFVLQKLMEKLQPEGKYKPLKEDIYKKSVNATTIFELDMEIVKAKFKFGQHLDKSRFDMIIQHLKDRGEKIDLITIKIMENLQKQLS